MVLLFLQLYGEEIEYAEDIFSTPPGVGRRVSKKGKSGDSSSTSPERNRKDDVTVCNSKKDDLLKCFYLCPCAGRERKLSWGLKSNPPNGCPNLEPRWVPN